MGRSILVVLLVTILAISRVSINPIPSACQLLFIIFAPRRGRVRSGGHWINKGHAKRLRLQQLDCHWGGVLTESRPRLLLLRVAPLWLLVILVIAHWMHCSITYEIRISRWFSRDWPIHRSPSIQVVLLLTVLAIIKLIYNNNTAILL